MDARVGRGGGSLRDPTSTDHQPARSQSSAHVVASASTYTPASIGFGGRPSVTRRAISSGIRRGANVAPRSSSSFWGHQRTSVTYSLPRSPTTAPVGARTPRCVRGRTIRPDRRRSRRGTGTRASASRSPDRSPGRRDRSPRSAPDGERRETDVVITLREGPPVLRAPPPWTQLSLRPKTGLLPGSGTRSIPLSTRQGSRPSEVGSRTAASHCLRIRSQLGVAKTASACCGT